MKTLVLLLALVLPSMCFGQWRVVDSLTSGNLYAIHFLDADTGFTYNMLSTMRKTTDGGMTWDTVIMPYSGFIHDINFASANVGYAVGGAWFPFGQHYANAILKTSDGGETWDSVFGNYSHGVFNHVEVLSEQEFYAAGNYGLIHSSDGGASLDSVVPSTLIYEEYLKASFPDANTGYVLGKVSIGGGAYLYNLYKSTNGGSSWQSIHSDTLLTPFRDFVMLASGYGLLTDEKGQILQTTNGGDSWQILQHSEPEVVINTLHLADNYLYAAGYNVADTTNGIYRSSDWGANWINQISSSAANFWIQDMSLPEPSVGYFGTFQQLYKNDRLLAAISPEPFRLTMYPNPTSGQLVIQWEERKATTIRVVNSLGQVTGMYSLDGEISQTLDLSPLPAGLYFIVFEQGGYQQVRQLVVEN